MGARGLEPRTLPLSAIGKARGTLRALGHRSHGSWSLSGGGLSVRSDRLSGALDSTDSARFTRPAPGRNTGGCSACRSSVRMGGMG